MNRKINLVYQDKDNVDQLDNISLTEIDSIFPYSCELLVCKYFNIFEEQQSVHALSVLLDKIRPGGQLIIGVADLIGICEDFLNKKIKAADFFARVRYCQNSMTVDDIMEYAENNNIAIVEIMNDKNYVNFVTLIKKQ